MIEWLMIAASVVFMSRAADMEGKSSFLWGFITFLVCLACAFLIPLPLINIGIGLVVSYLLLFADKVANR